MLAGAEATERALFEGIHDMTAITGQDLIAWGFAPGRWFKDGIDAANAMRAGGAYDDAIFAHLQTLVPAETLMRTNGLTYGVFLDARNEAERANAEAVF